MSKQLNNIPDIEAYLEKKQKVIKQPTKSSKFYSCQNYYSYLKFPEKYLREDHKLTARSGLEITYFNKFDRNKNIIEWNSESIAIPYNKPTFDGYGKIIGCERKNYMVDVYIKIMNNGIVQEILGEIKPYDQLFKPEEPKRKTTKSQKNYINKKCTWMINMAKWEMAEKFVENIRKRYNRNIHFMLFTEDRIIYYNELKHLKRK